MSIDEKCETKKLTMEEMGFKKCPYRISYENNGSTFQAMNEHLQKCVDCNGYDLQCRLYKQCKELNLI